MAVAQGVKRLFPLLDRVLVKRAEAVSKTAAGILLPESSQVKLQQGHVVAVGSGFRKENGEFVKPIVQPGDKVLLPEYGGTKVIFEDDEQEYQIYKEADILAKIE